MAIGEKVYTESCARSLTQMETTKQSDSYHGCICPPLFHIKLENIVLDELHLFSLLSPSLSLSNQLAFSKPPQQKIPPCVHIHMYCMYMYDLSHVIAILYMQAQKHTHTCTDTSVHTHTEHNNIYVPTNNAYVWTFWSSHVIYSFTHAYTHAHAHAYTHVLMDVTTTSP